MQLPCAEVILKIAAGYDYYGVRLPWRILGVRACNFVVVRKGRTTHWYDYCCRGTAIVGNPSTAVVGRSYKNIDD